LSAGSRLRGVDNDVVERALLLLFLRQVLPDRRDDGVRSALVEQHGDHRELAVGPLVHHVGDHRHAPCLDFSSLGLWKWNWSNS
jgi:hypothetical protein